MVPAGDHYANGVAERAIGTLPEIMKEMFTGRTFSILQLQTFAYHVCNTINGIPFALHKAGLDNLDPAIICPNRFLLGHANRRDLEDEFEYKASAAVYWGAQKAALTGKLG